MNDKLHREDGPAYEYADGDKEWWLDNSERHREDGPAIEYADGYKAWCLNGKEVHREVMGSKEEPIMEIDDDGNKVWKLERQDTPRGWTSY